MRFFLPQQIRHDYQGFQALTQLHAQAEEYFLEDIEIDMGATWWLDADMCAAFGALLYSLGNLSSELSGGWHQGQLIFGEM